MRRRGGPETLHLPALLLVGLAAGLWLTSVSARTYNRCELARELRDRHGLPEHQLPTWVCIAWFESLFNTSAIGRLSPGGSLDHGLFQMSDVYWCSPPGRGWACGLSCDKLEDDDISDDVACARRIYREHQRLSGDGFNAWVVYRLHCSGGRAERFVEGCFDKSLNANDISRAHPYQRNLPWSRTPTTSDRLSYFNYI